MTVEEAPRNMRCDAANCKNFAKHCIDTSSYKGNMYLCDDCLKKLYSALQQKFKTTKSKEKK